MSPPPTHDPHIQHDSGWSGPRAVSVTQMQQIDEAAIRTIGIPRLLLMEQAGLAVACAVRAMLPEPAQPILACCGVGYNGGDGLCAAWHLGHWGYPVRAVLAGEASQLREEPAIYARIIRALAIPVTELRGPQDLVAFRSASHQIGLIIDALLGIGLSGPVRPLYAQLIEWMNQTGAPILAVDIPSGLDADTGRPQGIAVKATTTVAMGLPKQGYFMGDGPAHVGQIIVADLGIPAHLVQSL